MSIEALQKLHPDVPKNIIIKVELLRLGVAFSRSALIVLQKENIQFKGYFLFSQDVKSEATINMKIPNWMYLKRDDAVVQVRLSTETPYVVDRQDDRYVLRDETGQEVEEVYFHLAPKWLNQVLEDGTPIQAICQPIGKDKIAVCFDYYCEYWKRNEQCRFCDMVSHLKVKKQEEIKAPTRQDRERLAKAVAVAFKEPGYRHLAMTSGSILGTRDGKSETEWFCEYLNTIRAHLPRGEWWPSYFQVGAKPKRDIQMLYTTGVTSLHLNLEVWDENIFKVVCPGKARFVGKEEWVKRAIQAVEVFGKGKILVNFVTGVEMAQPFGFKTVKEAVKSTLDGFDYLMSHNVLPRMDMWAVEKGSALSDQRPAPLEYYLELERGFLELRQKYNFAFPFPAYCHGCTPINCMADWDYYFWK